MWADTFLHAEQQHLLRLFSWAALSIVAGTAVGVLLASRRIESPLLKHFAIQMAAWGLVIAAIAAFGWRTAHLRDVSSATRLERVLWMNIGLDVGYAAIGGAIALTGWALARRMSAVGAGIAIIVQGAALLLIDLQFAAVISK